MHGILDPKSTDDLLARNDVGRIGIYDGVRCHVIPVSYAFEHGAVVGSSADGEKLRLLRRRPHDVCFEVDERDSLGNWRSVIGWGSFEELDPLPGVAAMQLLVDHLLDVEGEEPRPATTAPRMSAATGAQPKLPLYAADVPGHAPVAFRIRLRERTGRYEQR